MDTFLTIVGFAALAIVLSVLGAWPLMIGFGNLHAVWPVVPAIGFGAALSVSIPFGSWVALMARSGDAS